MPSAWARLGQRSRQRHNFTSRAGPRSIASTPSVTTRIAMPIPRCTPAGMVKPASSRPPACNASAAPAITTTPDQKVRLAVAITLTISAVSSPAAL